MGKALIIKGADFSNVAVDRIIPGPPIPTENKLKSKPVYGPISSGNGTDVDSSSPSYLYYCRTTDYYENLQSITIPEEYVMAIRLYNSTGGYVGKGDVTGMVSGTIDLTKYSSYKIRFVFSLPENISTITKELSETDLNFIYNKVLLNYL